MRGLESSYKDMAAGVESEVIDMIWRAEEQGADLWGVTMGFRKGGVTKVLVTT